MVDLQNRLLCINEEIPLTTRQCRAVILNLSSAIYPLGSVYFPVYPFTPVHKIHCLPKGTKYKMEDTFTI